MKNITTNKNIKVKIGFSTYINNDLKIPKDDEIIRNISLNAYKFLKEFAKDSDNKLNELDPLNESEDTPEMRELELILDDIQEIVNYSYELINVETKLIYVIKI